jgi:YjbE family integral membrane protein
MGVAWIMDFAGLLGMLEGSWDKLTSPQWYSDNMVPLINVLIIDLVLAGDNAIIVGLAASRVPKDIRNRVIILGIAAAVVLRILFASMTVKLLAIVGLTLAGGLLLLWVCWKMYREVTSGSHEAALDPGATPSAGPQLGFWSAVWTIILADVAMSLDNVLAVAGAAKGEPLVLVIGLAVSIVLMAIAAQLIAKLLVQYPWITWIGLFIILWVALEMIYKGSHQVACETLTFGCSETLFDAILHRLGLGPPGPALSP